MTTSDVLDELLRLLRRDFAALVLAVLAAVGSALMNVQISKARRPCAACWPRPLTGPAQELGALVNLVSSGVGGAALAGKAGGVLALAAAQAGLTAGYISLLAVVGERLCEGLRTELFDAIMRQVHPRRVRRPLLRRGSPTPPPHQDLAFFDGRRSGEIVDRLTTDIATFKSTFKQTVSMGLRSSTQVPQRRGGTAPARPHPQRFGAHRRSARSCPCS